MTRDDIIRMAQEAGFNVEQGFLLRVTGIDEDLERFAALVAAAAVRETSAEYRLGWNDGAMMEREECAKVCEQLDADGFGINCCADEIRARGQE
jgi:hypothetical protein